MPGSFASSFTAFSSSFEGIIFTGIFKFADAKLAFSPYSS
jgi:hypothetical protein